MQQNGQCKQPHDRNIINPAGLSDVMTERSFPRGSQITVHFPACDSQKPKKAGPKEAEICASASDELIWPYRQQKAGSGKEDGDGTSKDQEPPDPELHDKYLEEQHRANELAEEANGLHCQVQELQKQVNQDLLMMGWSGKLLWQVVAFQNYGKIPTERLGFAHNSALGVGSNCKGHASQPRRACNSDCFSLSLQQGRSRPSSMRSC